MLNVSHICIHLGSSWPWLYGSWIYNYLCNQCLSPLMWVRISIRARCTTLCDKFISDLQWFSPGPPVSSTNKTYCHDIAEILLNTIKQTNNICIHLYNLAYPLFYLSYIYHSKLKSISHELFSEFQSFDLSRT